MNIIEVKDLRKVYSNGYVSTVALDGVSFDVKEGEFLAIVGSSGCGKSTLMHILGLLDRPTSGFYNFGGKNVFEMSDDEAARVRNKKMGFVFQSFNLLPRTSIFNNVKLPLVYGGLSDEKEKEMVLSALESVGLKDKANNFSNQLSGGEQQRAAIARALVNHPAIIFADEPTGNLDSLSGQNVLELLQDLNDDGHTIILVTHEKYTSEMAQRIIEMKDGKIVLDEKVENRKLAKNGLIK
ncbi:MAG: ABC transporter ATP-binding protein [Candidatus Paceibacterota bacterium]|jgi:putative ABC transport system ATP-binding protein|nr:ABC transporter ATP-binding protein [Candidatus Paceibacterota bacterium]MDD4830716.1 ABC transporter ATP-binding protein [Candidatus Paceibacterota bacterium]MDD4875134.1 ABC transporter ATP-binding protein [Candidatus Paceibacterota bacterium]